MKLKLQIPDIPEEEQTPALKGLLILLEQFAERIQEQDETLSLHLSNHCADLQLVEHFCALGGTG